MSEFSAAWLALREPYDLRARNVEVLKAVATAVGGMPSLRIVDLACGTGSTMRAVAPHLPMPQAWRLLDNNLSLLALAADSDRPEGVRVTAAPLDLALDLEAALDGAVDLVTTSALLDLVSPEWLERLVVEIAARRLPLYAALTYDGQAVFSPPLPQDEQVIEAFNLHQRGDKGFGPALGPQAAATAIARFRAVGYRVLQGRSAWKFAPHDMAIQEEIVVGWAEAARDTGRVTAIQGVGWLAERREHIALGRSSISIGHNDFLAVPETP